MPPDSHTVPQCLASSLTTFTADSSQIARQQGLSEAPAFPACHKKVYADDVALLSASAQGLQQRLDSMQSFCAANGLTISIPKTA